MSLTRQSNGTCTVQKGMCVQDTVVVTLSDKIGRWSLKIRCTIGELRDKRVIKCAPLSVVVVILDHI